MTTALVWLLVTVGGYNGNNVVYSPPLADLASCERLQQKTVRENWYRFSTCIQVTIVK